MSDFENASSKSAVINGAGLLVMRLDGFWKNCAKYSRVGAYAAWNNELDIIWGELGGNYKEKDSEIKAFDKLNKEYAQSIIEVKTKRGFEKTGEDEKISRVKQKMALIKKQLFLKAIEDKLGLGSKWQDDSEDYLDG